MDSADLSAWLGKPPVTPEFQQNGNPEEGAESGSDFGQEPSITEVIESADTKSSDLEQPQSDVQEQDEFEHDSEEDLSRDRASKLRNGIIIEIPDIPDKDDYEHLPGHFTVDVVLSAYQRDKYVVKLASGEVELVRVPDISTFNILPSPPFHIHFLRMIYLHVLSFRLDSFD